MELRVIDRVKNCPPCPHLELRFDYETGIGSGHSWESQTWVARCIHENVWEPGGCFNPERCSSVWDAVFERMVPVGINTEPDGFCKWGARREDA